MPRTREAATETAGFPRAGAPVRILRAPGAFGDLHTLAREAARPPGIAVVVGAGWDIEDAAAQRLADALSARPDAAFAVEEHATGVDPPVPVDSADLIARPRDLGLIAVRTEAAARLGWPDFGPPDLVLDAAAPWALAAALALRGGIGLCVPGLSCSSCSSCSTTRPLDHSTTRSLQPEGLAWLVACALRWGPGGRLPPDLAERLWARWTAELSARGFDGLTPPGEAP